MGAWEDVEPNDGGSHDHYLIDPLSLIRNVYFSSSLLSISPSRPFQLAPLFPISSVLMYLILALV